MRRKVLFILYFFLSKLYSYSVKNNRIIDNYGRERLYHGVNVIYKKFPWHPIVNKFNYNLSFNDEDIGIINNLGLNIIRLGLMWPGVEPIKGQYNMIYLNVMKNIVQKLDNYNISVIVEFHQDALSEYFCGEGLPDWIINNSNFPMPIGLPYNKFGKPSKEKCLSKDWWKYQFTFAAGEMYKKLYTDSMIVNSFLGYWNIVAKTFNDSNNVIGYEIINEPWAGNIYKNPELLLPKYADKKYIEPFYNKLFNNLSLSGYLNNKLFFFEPVTCSINGAGFDYPPNKNNTKCVLAYHCYFPPEISVDQLFRSRMRDIRRLGIAGFITEMGATNIVDILTYTDRYFQSWAVWQYKIFSGITGDGSMFFNKNGTIAEARYLLNRSYPRAICGHGTYYNFNLTTNEVLLIYENNPKCNSDTEIYISTMPNNYKISVLPPTLYLFDDKILYIKPLNYSVQVIVRIF